MNPGALQQTSNAGLSRKQLSGGFFMKRKAANHQALKNNSTPSESMAKTEFAAEYNHENPKKYANRNSKKGMQGQSENER